VGLQRHRLDEAAIAVLNTPRRAPAAKAAAPKPKDDAKPTFKPAAFAKDWVRRHKKLWVLRIPGNHYSGLSNEELLEVRKEEGRNFGKTTTPQAEHVEERIADKFENRKTPPSDSMVRQVAQAALKEWLVMRVENGGLDISLRPLTPRYAAWKAKKYPGRPIGVARGRWIGAVKKRGYYDLEG
jgi:hypothetical protein